jgi:hypothetical protein
MKSKFDELRECLIKSRLEYNKYKTEAYDCAKKIFEKLQTYYEIPLPYIQVIPIGEDQNSDNIVSLSESLILLEDYFWHFGIAIILYEKENQFPHESIQIHFQIKKENNGFIARVGEDSPQMNVNSDAEIQAYLEYIFTKIKEEYTLSIQSLSEIGGVNTRKIGFKINKE